MSDEITVFEPYGFVKLVDHAGSELDVVNAARTSFAVESSELSDRDKGLLRFLLREKHGTPFEFGFRAQFHLRVPIFVMRELVRHRIASVNEESGRYSELRGEFYIPERDQVRTQVGKPGSYTFKRVEDDLLADWFTTGLADLSEQCFRFYREAIDRGIAKELARAALTLNIYTEVRWGVNARSLMNFLTLRNDPNAQYEIRVFASAIEDIFAEHMPTVHQAFVDNGRVAP